MDIVFNPPSRHTSPTRYIRIFRGRDKKYQIYRLAGALRQASQQDEREVYYYTTLKNIYTILQLYLYRHISWWCGSMIDHTAGPHVTTCLLCWHTNTAADRRPGVRGTNESTQQLNEFYFPSSHKLFPKFQKLPLFSHDR